MFRNHFTVLLRNLMRQRGFAFINIAGLAIGLCCCLLISLYVLNELSYDRNNQHYPDIYRVYIDGRFGGEDFKGAFTPAPMAAACVAEIPEVVQAVRMDEDSDTQIRYGDKEFIESRLRYADATLFDVFSIELLQGDPATALSAPLSVVITESTARKYFGAEDPMGKGLTMDDGSVFQVTGVIADPEHNSHIEFDLIASLISQERSKRSSWISNSFQTYLRLRPGADPEAVNEKINTLVRIYGGPQLQDATGASWEALMAAGNRYAFFLEPLKDVYLRSPIENELGPQGNIQYVTIFSIVAVFILIIACVNFMNLSTARSANRAREVGIRKTIGSQRRHLIGQFLLESVFLCFIAVLIAMLLAKLAMPLFNNLAGKDLAIHYFRGDSWFIIPLLLTVTILVGVIAGSYPAFFLSAFHPVKVLRGETSRGSGSGRLRGILVIIQFAVSVALIFGTLVVRQQLHFFQDKNMGYDKEHLLIISQANFLGNDFDAFRQELKRNPNIRNASYTNTIPGSIDGIHAYRIESAPSNEAATLIKVRTDAEFAETWGLTLKTGRFFEPDRAADSSAAVINASAVSVLGYDPDSGDRLVHIGTESSQYCPIIGIVEDVYFASLHRQLMSVVFRREPGPQHFLAVRLRPDNIAETVAYIERTWKNFVPQQMFQYSFLDESFDEFYRAEMRTSQVFSVFSTLAILIACMGLFGLASYLAQRKFKEIGIRKVLGAPLTNITIVFLRGFAKWILVAIGIAWPIAYYIMNRWLQNFAYRSTIQLHIFLISALLALLISVLTISYHTIRSARTNPVDALRYE